METTRRRRSGTLAALLPSLVVVTVLATASPSGGQERAVELTVTPGHAAPR